MQEPSNHIILTTLRRLKTIKYRGVKLGWTKCWTALHTPKTDVVFGDTDKKSWKKYVTDVYSIWGEIGKAGWEIFLFITRDMSIEQSLPARSAGKNHCSRSSFHRVSFCQGFLLSGFPFIRFNSFRVPFFQSLLPLFLWVSFHRVSFLQGLLTQGFHPEVLLSTEFLSFRVLFLWISFLT